MTLTARGFAIPNAVVGSGDTVTYVNTDDLPHRLAFEPASGVECAERIDVIQPGGHLTCVFTTAGSFVVSDEAALGTRQVVSVADHAAILSSVMLHVTRSLSQRSIVTLSGKVNINRAGIQIDIIARCNGTTTYKKIGQTATSSDGTFIATIKHPRYASFVVNALDLPRIATSPFLAA